MAEQIVPMTATQDIDITEFARLQKTLAGEMDIQGLSRLQDLIVSGRQPLRYELHGILNARRQAEIDCIIRGSVLLHCQRCLGTFEHVLDIRSTLVFVSEENQLPAIEEEDESVDYVVAEKTLDFSALIEDEIILALPMAPRHKVGECDGAALRQAADGKSSPFAVLSKLKRL